MNKYLPIINSVLATLIVGVFVYLAHSYVHIGYGLHPGIAITVAVALQVGILVYLIDSLIYWEDRATDAEEALVELITINLEQINEGDDT